MNSPDCANCQILFVNKDLLLLLLILGAQCGSPYDMNLLQVSGEIDVMR
jgi:hypothetical protein